MSDDASFAMVVLLGALHGVNPAMGWLFAVSLGLQEQSGRAVWRALGPLALGHAGAIAAALLFAAIIGFMVPLDVLQWIAGVSLTGFGVFHLRSHRHVGRGGMCVGTIELALWSFFVASAHGAGLMVLPIVLNMAGSHPHAGTVAAHGMHLRAGLPPGVGAGILATLFHTIGYLAMSGLIAWIVYDRVGLRLLNRAWINLNVIWAGALIATGILVLVV